MMELATDTAARNHKKGVDRLDRWRLMPYPARPLIGVLCLSVSSILFAREPDSAKLATIHSAMEQAISAKQAAGIVTLVMKDGKIVHLDAAGMADIGAGKPMTNDTMFWIASMTKSINATAIMTAVEAGLLSLDEPASKWLPELGQVKLADGSAPKQPITLRLLLSHTAGIAFPPRKADDGAVSLKQYVQRLVKAPLAFEPGTSYEYGFGPTVAGRILEIVSGMSYDAYLQKHIFDPLGMKDTQFNPDDAHRARIAQTYKLDEDTHELVVSYNPFFTSSAAAKRMIEPAGGLFSTATDMGRFYAMVANGGELDGVRILSAASVKEMSTPVSTAGKPITYALGWQCTTSQNPGMSPLGIGSFGHGGAFATNGWIDPVNHLATVFMVQNVLVPESNKPREAFQKIVVEALGK